MSDVPAVSASPSFCCARQNAHSLSIVAVIIVGIALTVFLYFHGIDSRSAKVIIAVYVGGCVLLPIALYCLWPKIKVCCCHPQREMAEEFAQKLGPERLKDFTDLLESSCELISTYEPGDGGEAYYQEQVQLIKKAITSFKEHLWDPIDNQLLKDCFRRAGKIDIFNQLKSWVEDPDRQLQPFKIAYEQRMQEIRRAPLGKSDG